MLFQILTHTPAWVFAVFALLLWLGARALAASRSHLNKVVVVPLVMGALAISGVYSAFGRSPDAMLSLAAWAVTAGLIFALIGRGPAPAGSRYDPTTREFLTPGSAMPLALMMGIFFTKYVVGVLLAMHPQYALQSGFAIGISALYGLFSGAFAGRSLRLLKLALRHKTGAPVGSLA